MLQGLCCFAANLFYCLRLPCQYNARGRWPKYYAWNVRSCGVDAASQQTYFIISGSPSNTMLGGGEQNTILWMYSRVVSSVGRLLLRSKPIILSPAFLMANGCGMIIYLCLSIAYLTTLNSSIANWTFGCIAIWTFRCIAIWYPKSIAWWLFPLRIVEVYTRAARFFDRFTRHLFLASLGYVWVALKRIWLGVVVFCCGESVL